jgi:hypothetical protein
MEEWVDAPDYDGPSGTKKSNPAKSSYMDISGRNQVRPKVVAPVKRTPVYANRSSAPSFAQRSTPSYIQRADISALYR